MVRMCQQEKYQEGTNASASMAQVSDTEMAERNGSSEAENEHQNTVLVSMSVVLNVSLAVVMVAGITVGATHLNKCPVQPYIPIYLIVLGVTSILSLILTFLASTRKQRSSCILSSTFLSVVHLFNFCWLIAGSVWTYPIYPPNYKPGPLYCQRTTYKLAFAVTTLLWVTVGLLFACGLCFGVLNSRENAVSTERIMPSQKSSYGATRNEPIAGDV